MRTQNDIPELLLKTLGLTSVGFPNQVMEYLRNVVSQVQDAISASLCCRWRRVSCVFCFLYPFPCVSPNNFYSVKVALLMFQHCKQFTSYIVKTVMTELRDFTLSVLWSSGQSYWLQIQRSGFFSRGYQIFLEVVGPERGPLSPVSTIEELLERKTSSSGLENRDYGRRGSAALSTRFPSICNKVGT
jgi:hypothetical protein